MKTNTITLDSFRWDWPKKINRLEIQDLFRLQFIEDHANVILLGTVGTRQNPSRHRAWLRRLPAGHQRALCQRHRRGQRLANDLAFSPRLAICPDYIDLVRGEARRTVEEFVTDWIIKEHGWTSKDRPVVKVYFEDEKDIPFPSGKSLRDYVP